MTVQQEDREPDARIDEAATWLAAKSREEIGGAAVPALRQQFGLTPVEACEAIRRANALRFARAT